MLTIACFGEALVDLLEIKNNRFIKHSGGAPANVAVAIAKLGGQSCFLGQVGRDKFGKFLNSSMQSAGVNTSHLLFHSSASTALALVHLDEQGDRSFSFYRDNTADILLNTSQLQSTWLQDVDILHLGSNSMTTTNGYETTCALVELALAKGIKISFDPNLRAELWPKKAVDINRIKHVINQASLLKFSWEELQYLSNEKPNNLINDCLSNKGELVVVTNGDKAVNFYGKNFDGILMPEQTNVVDTTGAGDSFIGSLLFYLSQCPFDKEILANKDRVVAALKFSLSCAAATVSRYGSQSSFPNKNEISMPS